MLKLFGQNEAKIKFSKNYESFTKMQKNIILVVSELVWDLRFVNLIMHYIVVFCGIVAIYLNERHGEMRLK